MNRPPFDLIISDIGMPLKDGFDLVARIRAMQPPRRSDVPMIALTAHGRDEDQQRVLAAAFHKHLRKPIDPVDLVLAVAATLRFGTAARELQGR